MSESGSRRVGGADGSPTICAGIVSPAGVETVNAISGAAPDDHFTAGPHCRGEHSAIGRVGGAGWSPRVVSTWRSRCRSRSAYQFCVSEGILLVYTVDGHSPVHP